MLKGEIFSTASSFFFNYDWGCDFSELHRAGGLGLGPPYENPKTEDSHIPIHSDP